MSDPDRAWAMANEAFTEWWHDEGQQFCQSLLVATENQTVEQKVRFIFIDAYLMGHNER